MPHNPKILYIIGNGFDLHHDIPSSYKDFYNWMKSHNYYDAINWVNEIYDMPTMNWWADFEHCLGDMNIPEYSSNLAREHYPDYTNDDFSESDRYRAGWQAETNFDLLITAMKSRFSEWIENLPEPNPKKKVPLTKSDAFFISFNYTLTLERLYCIPCNQIWHIHGCVSNNEDFILGHGKSATDFKQECLEQEPSPDNADTPEEMEEWYQNNYDPIYEDAKDAVISEITKLKKPVEEIISKNSKRFDDLVDIKKIIIYGFSFSNIDMPYIREIVSRLNTPIEEIKWEISYYPKKYTKKEMVKARQWIVNFLKAEFSIPVMNIKLYTLSELQNSNQLSLLCTAF